MSPIPDVRPACTGRVLRDDELLGSAERLYHIQSTGEPPQLLTWNQIIALHKVTGQLLEGKEEAEF